MSGKPQVIVAEDKEDNGEMERQVAETVQASASAGASRNPDKGLACFVNIDDPVPQCHPRGEYPYDNERGILLIKLLKKLFSIIPSTLCPGHTCMQ